MRSLISFSDSNRFSHLPRNLKCLALNGSFSVTFMIKFSISNWCVFLIFYFLLKKLHSKRNAFAGFCFHSLSPFQPNVGVVNSQLHVLCISSGESEVVSICFVEG